MISPEIITYANERILLEIAAQEKQLDVEIRGVMAEMASRGMSRSGNMIVGVQAVCVSAVNTRADLIWNILHRGITTIGIQYEDDVEQQLRDVVEKFLPENMRGLSTRVAQVAQQIGMADITNRIPDEVTDARRAALAKVFSEIKLFVMTLKKSPPVDAYTPQFNIYHSTIGAVQTGHQSVANINLQLNAVSRESLIKVLDEIANELDTADIAPGQNKAEIIELVNDGKTELSKEKPNLTKLASYLSAIGNAIGVVANLRPAYEALKSAAALINITLP